MFENIKAYKVPKQLRLAPTPVRIVYWTRDELIGPFAFLSVHFEIMRECGLLPSCISRRSHGWPKDNYLLWSFDRESEQHRISKAEGYEVGVRPHITSWSFVTLRIRREDPTIVPIHKNDLVIDEWTVIKGASVTFSINAAIKKQNRLTLAKDLEQEGLSSLCDEPSQSIRLKR